MSERLTPTRRGLLGLAALGGAAALFSRFRSATASETPRPKLSDAIPDVRVVTQTGDVRRLYGDYVRDRILVFSFMYTECNGLCPLTSALFADLREPLYQALGRRVTLVSMTLDPERDTPARLRDYAANYGVAGDRDDAGLASWRFVTATPDDVESVRRALGYVDPDPVRDADRSQHAALFTFGNDRSDRWGAMPVGLTFAQTVSGVLRTVAETFEQRYRHLPRPV